MKFFNAQITGSMSLTGSFEIPVSTTTGSYPNLETGSLLLHVDGKDRFLRVFNGTSWVKVSEQLTPPAGADIEYLVVAGGGGGGSMGGGGAGGLLSGSLTSIESGSTFDINIGAGGSGQIEQGGATPNNGSTSSLSSLSGTSFTTVAATGGGHGGGSSNAAAQLAEDGGSGGGGGGLDQNPGTAGSGTVGQGNAGGAGRYVSAGTSGAGGGGGGAGETGTAASGNTTPGDGGDGKQSSITGTSTYYAGGGGGGSYSYGGSGNGSTGGQGGGTDGSSNSGYSSNGTANTGGGAGSGGFKSTGWQAGSGNGGSGVVILAYDSGSINALGGHEGDAGNGRKYHKFGTSGTFYIGGTSEFSYVTDDLLMHYDFANAATWNGSASTITDLQGNHNLTVNSSPTLDFTHGGGLSLDGIDDYASKESSISFTPYMAEIWLTSDIAIDANIYSDSTYASPLALGVYPGGFTFGAYTGNMTSETIAFWGANYTSTGATYIRDTFSAGTYQIVANWNGSTYDIWVNGSKKTTYAISTYGNTTLHARDSIILGKEDHASQSYEFGGRIHNVKIYSAQKTDAEVTQNWNALRNRFGL